MGRSSMAIATKFLLGHFGLGPVIYLVTHCLFTNLSLFFPYILSLYTLVKFDVILNGCFSVSVLLRFFHNSSGKRQVSKNFKE